MPDKTSPAQIKSIGQIHISFQDFDRAKVFYRDILQSPLLIEVPEQKMAFFDCGGVRIYLGVPTSPAYKARSFLYYRVDDIDAAYQRLKNLGVEFLNAPRAIRKSDTSELRMVGFKDTEGNLAQLMCEKPLN